ncbi:glycoside hydrolase family 3 N-terminal domain-containing protein [Lachnoclostridium sp. Marseille-P6806]|uniref:glycoside hydrolase family 3 N-terminal domain-containing protein n=1 Tax=Lachnoclostridium sp. Marseille-P6806 TaxID=2364793 RepID=UPI0010322F1B|nr:glycoside hydrolase family 3 N-terminal domain-containing protein [Lachnoclostridium sp. Marseille-P6806]
MSEAYKNTALSPKERADALLEELTLDEKIAQIRGIWGLTDRMRGEHGIDDAAYAKLFENGIGQVSTLHVRELHSLEEVVKFQRDTQKKIMEQSPHHIPAVFHMEGLCGPFIIGATSFPSGIGRGSSFDPELERKIGGIVAREELAAGITQILAPVLDVSRDSRMGRQGESYGEDPTLGAALGAAYVHGIQETGTDGRHADACAKHFLGFHNSQGGIHGANVDIGDALLDEVYGKAFQAAIAEADLHAVMPSYNCVSGIPNSASKKVLTRLLREEMGFDGCVVSDYGAVGNVHEVQRVGETKAQAGLKCLNAGMDCELPDGDAFGQAEFREVLEAEERLHRETGTACAELASLDRAVRNVLAAKFRMGLFEHPYAQDAESLKKLFDRPENDEVSLQSARESIVLLKNNGVLPLDSERMAELRKNGKEKLAIALIGPHGGNARQFFGGYTHLSMVEAVHAVANSTAGVGESGTTEGKTYLHVPGTDIQSDETEEFDEILRWIHPDCLSLREELARTLPEAEIRCAHGYYIAGADESGFDEALRVCGDADVILVTLGGKHGSCSVASMGEGVDGTDINLPAAQDAFILKAHELGKPMIGLHFDGRPISSDVADEYLDAILECWNPSEKGAQAITETLLGVNNPSGKMPVTCARSAGQIPIYYNHPSGSAWHQGGSIGFKNYVDMSHLPRYFFGQGLSYTTFAYSGLNVGDAECDAVSVGPSGKLRISCDVQNTGSRSGTETVQLYLKDVYASMTRPVMELAGFVRVKLRPGEKKTVTFTVEPSQTAFLDESGRWKIEQGRIEVLIGGASHELPLRGAFIIAGDQYIQGKDRKFYAAAEVKESV